MCSYYEHINTLLNLFSLDADHDGAYKDCSDDTSNVMSTIASFPREAVRASNPWKFSTCSVDAFGAYLDTYVDVVARHVSSLEPGCPMCFCSPTPSPFHKLSNDRVKRVTLDIFSKTKEQ